MADILTIKERSERMRLIRFKDTKPEVIVRKMLFGMGYRYRLHSKNLPGRPDIIFYSRKKVIFVHGCFWHWHRGCKLFRMPKSRPDYWFPKLTRNRMRDKKNYTMLRKLGFEYLVIWECQTRDEEKLATTVGSFMRGNQWA